ncbi:MAG: ribose-5-phosphate isomerase RpiA [Pyrinomonadaceae bacterium]|nr:ribose-5-phosphate isomerase RpiA [Pyrinomonadaceae bacterium]
MDAKQRAGEKAVEFVEDGMNVGLGTGSTVYWTIMRLGSMVKQGLNIRAVPTSRRTEKLAREQDITLVGFNEIEELDLTIDGADEINPSLDLTKGGGGALLREKLVAAASKRLIIVADESKRVAALGRFPLPVEVVPFAWQVTARRLAEDLSCTPTLRLDAAEQPYVTDNGNYILDCACGEINDPASLHRALKLLAGVIETGLFIGMADIAIIASESGVEVIKAEQNIPRIEER